MIVEAFCPLPETGLRSTIPPPPSQQYGRADEKEVQDGEAIDKDRLLSKNGSHSKITHHQTSVGHCAGGGSSGPFSGAGNCCHAV